MCDVGAVGKLRPVVVDISNENDDQHGAGQRFSGMFISADDCHCVNSYFFPVQNIGRT